VFGEGLSATQPGIGRTHGAGRNEHLTVPFKHHEGCALVGKPAESGEGDETVITNHDQSLEAMPDAGQAKVSAIRADPILDGQVPGLHRNTDAESVERQNAMFGDLRKHGRLG
jgi:hypothetical protein